MSASNQLELDSELKSVQRWFRAMVMGHEQGEGDVEQIIAPSARQSAAERLAVYQRGYTLRLLECLRAGHPGLRHALGQPLFDQFALDYLGAYPPRSYTLGALGQHFAQHLAATRPDDEDLDDGEPWTDFIVDLARLERLVTEVFDGPGLERRDGWEPPAVPERPTRNTRVEVAPSLRILRSSYPVGRYLLAVYRGEAPPLPLPEPTFVALGRRDYVVRLYDVTGNECQVLEALSRGEPLGAAAQNAELPIDLAWERFKGWAQAGLFAAVTIAQDSREVG